MGDYFTNPSSYPADTGVQYIRRSVTFDSSLLTSTLGIPIGAIPAGAIIDSLDANIETAFNAGSTNVLTVGSSATPAGIGASASIIAGTAGYKRGLTGALCGTPLAADTIIYAQYSPTGTAGTAGKAEFVVKFYPKREGTGTAWPGN